MFDKGTAEKLLDEIEDPHTGRNFLAGGMVKGASRENGKAVVDICLRYPARGYVDELSAVIKERLLSLPGVDDAEITITWDIQAHSVQKSLKPMENIKNVIAVASGKGGVGKSTVSVNLALALLAEGAQVGILDADIYGPSQPMMLGIKGQPESKDGKTLEPVENHGLQAMSIGFLIEEGTPMIWRGPMVTQALEQLLNDTNWRDLDYLVVDLPPGTGDVQLTLAQKIPVSGAVIVTTPQSIATLDARKGVKMFEKVDVPLLGIIENMSMYICKKCGHETPVFGSGGGDSMAKESNVELLGHLPLDPVIREQTDQGMPPVVAEPDGRIAGLYRDLARRTAGHLAVRSKDYSARFPKIVIQNN